MSKESIIFCHIHILGHVLLCYNGKPPKLLFIKYFSLKQLKITLIEKENGTALLENSLAVSYKFKHTLHLLFDPAITFLEK